MMVSCIDRPDNATRTHSPADLSRCADALKCIQDDRYRVSNWQYQKDSLLLPVGEFSSQLTLHSSAIALTDHQAIGLQV